MKKIFPLLAACLALGCTNAQKAEFDKQALDKNLINTKGQSVRFADILKKHKGKTLVIEVWASWCSDCIKAIPPFKELQAKHPEANYVFLSVDRAEDKWIAAIEKFDLRGDHYWSADGMKGEFGKAIDLDWIPRYIIVDKKGRVALYRAIETDFDLIDKTLNDLK
jgi:thiol-disulfide isomerase/thioredoxin